MTIAFIGSSKSLIVRAASALALTSGLALATSVASAQTFTGLGNVPDGTQSYARSVSDDGSVVAGLAFIPDDNGTPTTGYRAFRWTGAGMQNLGAMGSGPYWHSGARGVSANDGSVVVGSGSFVGGERAFRWTEAEGMVSLGVLPGYSYSHGFGASADGSVVVGDNGTNSTYFRAFRWTGAGMQDLGALPGYVSSSARGVSGNGLVVVGVSTKTTSRAFRWAGGSMSNLGTLKQGAFSEAWAADFTGAVVVGVSDSNVGERAFRWTLASGKMTSLGVLAGDAVSHAWGVSGDGTRVVGSSGVYPGTPHPGSPGRAAFLWTGAGMVDLNAYLSGVMPPGWVLREARAISADGNTIVGYGINPSGQPEAWVADVP